MKAPLFRKPPPYFSAEMATLRGALEKFGPGVTLVPAFAMSVFVKPRGGKLVLINRRGAETKG